MRNNTPPFRGKTVVIVGGSKGIGKATAFELVRLGANVCLIARHRALLVKVQQELMNLKGDDEQEIDIISADATIEDELKPALDIYLNEKGCDVLINCVGGARPRYVHDYALADFMKAMEWNYLSAIIPIMTVLPYFLQQGEGHIVNISSIAGYLGMIGYTTYAPTKFAIVGLSEALRHELRPYHIHVSVVYPPDTDTSGLKGKNEICGIKGPHGESETSPTRGRCSSPRPRPPTQEHEHSCRKFRVDKLGETTLSQTLVLAA